MSLEKELVAHVNRYIAAESSFEELARWVSQHEDELLLPGLESVSAQLASAVSLTAWELREGHRPPESLREAVVEDLNAILGAGARR